MQAWIFLFSLGLLTFGFGQDLVVTTEVDTVDANDGLFSLREAVVSSNMTAGAQTIRFDESVFAPGNNRIIYLKSALEVLDNSGSDISGINAKVTLDGSRIDSSAAYHKDAIILTGGNCVISHIYFQNFLGSAIVIDSLNTGGNQIGPGNQISTCGGAGILIIDSDDNSITGNDIWNCGSDTLVIGKYSFVRLDGIMLLFNADKNSITGNNCWANYGSGIGCYFSSSNIVTDNFLAIHNSYGIAILEGTGGNIISKNELLANLVGIMLFGGKNIGNSITANIISDEATVSPQIMETRIPYDAEGSEEILNSPLSCKINRTFAIPSLLKDSRENYAMIKNSDAPGPAAEVFPLGIHLGMVNDVLISDNKISNLSGLGMLIQGTRYIDSSGVEPDTMYIFPEKLEIEQNRFERLGNYSIMFQNAHDILFKDNFFHNVYSAIYGMGITSFDPREAGLDSTDRGNFTIINNILSESNFNITGIYILRARNIHFENNEITNFVAGFATYDVDTCQIIRNNIKTIQYFGIHVQDSKSCIVRDNFLEDNKQNGIFVNSSGNSVHDQSAAIMNNRCVSTGIHIDGLTSVMIKSNQLDYSQGDGIFVNEVRNAGIYHNQLRNGAMSGLLASSVDSLIINNNEFRDSGQTGATISNGLYTSLVNNDFSGNRSYGLSIDSVQHVQVSANDIIANSNGIYTESIGDLQIRHNNVIENLEIGLELIADSVVYCDSNYFFMNNTGISVSTIDSIQIRYNSFVTNSKFGLYNENPDSLDARWNYWGHMEGPTIGDSLYPGSRLGDKIGGPIIYKPFLTGPDFISSLKPKILSLEPNESKEAGGEKAYLFGRNFMQGLHVLIGSDTVQQVHYLSLERLQLVIPPAIGGYYNVYVINPNGQADTLENGFYYIPEEPLVINEPDLPLHYALHQNFPNPFNPVTTIRYDIVNATHVELSIYNIAGKRVATLVNQKQNPGKYAVTWDARNMASGLYFYTIKSKFFSKTRKLILLK
jgi:parallel beta-helix repeat protein